MTRTSLTVLVVEDDIAHGDAVAQLLDRAGYDVLRAASVDQALKVVDAKLPDIVITDLVLGTRHGTEVLRQVKDRHPEIEVVIVSGFGTIEDAVESMQLGAAYYFTKPLNVEHVRREVARIAAAVQARRAGHQAIVAAPPPPAFTEIVATTPPMMRVFDLVQQIAPTNATVLIQGENGTGKELVAKAIHGLSSRRAKPFVALNCAALNEGLLESELFGHEKGAFTGAGMTREGRFEFADKGTLFLDEVGDMPLPVQVKLLRVIQEREITRVGSNAAIKVDVRLIAATNKSLAEEVRRGTFREDLYYRLKVVSIVVPPLRDRRGEIPILAERFLTEFAARHGRPVLRLSPDALRLLVQYDWPGNVRELQNAIESMVLLAPGPEILPDDLPAEFRDSPRPGTALVAFDALEGMTLKRVERELIRLHLEKHDGNRAKVARSLGISERTLYRKLKEYGMT